MIDSWLGGGMGQTAIWLTPRKIIEQVGLWNEELRINQDGEFFSRVMGHVTQIKYVKSSKVYYRSTENSITKNYQSFDRAESLIHSYELYTTNLKEYLFEYELRLALARNFLGFIYQYHPVYPQLIKQAWVNIKKLNINIKDIPMVGGQHFKKIVSVIGFMNTLKLRMMSKSLFNL